MNWTDFEVLREYVEERITESSVIGDDRKNALTNLAGNIQRGLNSNGQVKLIFICTHNSRRSHLAHLWAQLSAGFYEVERVFCYSGGTEATAFNQRAVKALQDAGMRIVRLDDRSNPVYKVNFPGCRNGIKTFSKIYSDPPNPTEEFIAVMTCADADEACPVVHGANARHAIPYEDPKVSDDTIEESVLYADRCRQIAREMFYLFSRVSNNCDHCKDNPVSQP